MTHYIQLYFTIVYGSLTQHKCIAAKEVFRRTGIKREGLGGEITSFELFDVIHDG